MKKYMLISVFEREICSKIFNNLYQAQKEMLKELNDNLKDNLEDYPDLIPGEKIEVYEDGDEYAYGPTWAWSNADSDCNCDWKIIEIK